MKLIQTLSGGSVLGLMLTLTSTALADPHTHDGFHLQLQAGLGYYGTSAESAGFEESMSGLSMNFGLYLGGSPIPGLVIGGALTTDYIPSPTFESNGMEVELEDVSQYVVGIGPYVDFYPDPNGGLHFQGLLGWGGIETSSEGNVGGSDPTGLLIGIGAGYEFWIGDEWSVGPLGRFEYGAFSFNDVSYPTTVFSLNATFTYH